MVEGGEEAGLLAEARETIGIPRELLGERLDGNRSTELRVLGLPDDTHPPLADLLDEPVMGQLATGSQRRLPPPRE